jgi:hypothetical protein
MQLEVREYLSIHPAGYPAGLVPILGIYRTSR